MIITQFPRGVLSQLFLMASAGSYFMPEVVASEPTVTAFETNEELNTAMDHYCAGNFGSINSAYGDVKDWDVSKITSLEYLLGDETGQGTPWRNCNPNISNWDVSSVTNFKGAFNGAHSFNQDLSKWDVSSGTNFIYMFHDARTFNQDISKWNVTSATNMHAMFLYAVSFNQDLSEWDVSSNTDFQGMFLGAENFNQDLSKWDVSSGTTFHMMFRHAYSFNQDISKWDVSSGIDFLQMFLKAENFNQDISDWNVSSGTNFVSMFEGATSFDQQSLYCKWNAKVQQSFDLKSQDKFCVGGSNCGMDGDCTTAAPTPSPAAASTAHSGGDPHFKTFNGKAFSYHGECDLVLMRSKSFDGGKGLFIHVRTTRMENYRGAAYSFISAVAVQMGNTVLEVSAEDGSLLVDGSRPQAIVSSAVEEGGAEDVLSLAEGYTLTRSTKGKHGLIIVYDLNLGNEEKISIRCNTKSMMLYVDVTGYFEDSEGLLGGSEEGLGSRPDATGHRFDMTGNWNSYGEEWQVLDTEPNLFQEQHRFPQYPQGCVYESTLFKKNKRMLRRRLLLDSVDEAALEVNARKACAKKSVGEDQDNIMSQFCFNDVMATGDLELAEDPFYHASATE